MWNYKIAMTTFGTSQYRDGGKVLKMLEMKMSETHERAHQERFYQEHCRKSLKLTNFSRFLDR